ncbi:PREDICTED: uncharacterized protein LOC108363856 [Rhagoletis zephyria]|uniref:uncharacterized protein LOC108363856 n=1 Tax=Rhagoletis zephyria TaxID=28612 RepID=UPI0008112E18|nr:PREDICTED: uncharacterized protein LOC108363856 [Rhagoletis zephyria]
MVQQFFCFRLETAAMIIGWLGAVGSVISVVVFGFCLGYLDEIVQKIIESAPENTKLDPDQIRTILTVAFVIFLILNAINMFASICLILGTMKQRHLLLLPWLLNTGIALLFAATYYVLLVVEAVQMSYSSNIGLIIFASINLALDIYVWLAIYSHFKNIRNNREQQERLIPPAGGVYPSYTNM